MHVPDRLVGLRVVADPAAIDGARFGGDQVMVLRFAPDDAFAPGADTVEVDDPDAIVELETGFVGIWCDLEDVARRIEWSIPPKRPGFAQGAIAGVPARLVLPGGERVLVVCAAAYADELTGRLG